MPLVSVVIPTYNRTELVSQAISSVLAQDFTDWELLVIDDGSTDETPETVAKTLASWPAADRCFYYQQPHRGVSAARNLGLSHSRGKYLAFLDSDDLWRPVKLRQQTEFFRSRPEAAAVYTDELWLRGGRQLNQKKRHRKYSGWIFDRCLELCLISPSSILLRREVFDRIGLFDETLPACEDYDLWLRLTKDYPVYLIDQPLVIKRALSPDQLSVSCPALDRFRVRALEKILETDLSDWQRKLVLENLNCRLNFLAKGSLKRFRLGKALSYWKKLSRCRPGPSSLTP